MIHARCRTNLDLFNEEWPNQFVVCPRVGELIESLTPHGYFRLRLAVHRLTYTWRGEIELELHDWIPNRSVRQFYEWYAPLVGKSVSAFI